MTRDQLPARARRILADYDSGRGRHVERIDILDPKRIAATVNASDPNLGAYHLGQMCYRNGLIARLYYRRDPDNLCVRVVLATQDPEQGWTYSTGYNSDVTSATAGLRFDETTILGGHCDKAGRATLKTLCADRGYLVLGDL